ncbi:head-tail connector protein [Streptomyces sp. NPDC059759]|uniref:head-tail connector protein n=1 Tax=Streptomyces sp. NPDC059759 TaxID=3346936 RepID=UPI00365DCCD4
MAIVTLADAKKQLNIPDDETSEDVEILGFIDAATAAVEEQLGTVVEPRTVVDELDFSRPVRSFLLQVVPVISLTSLTSLDGSRSWDVSPGAAHVDKESGRVTLLGATVSGTAVGIYQAGVTAPGANIRLAAKIILQHLWETQRGTMGVQLGGDGEAYVPGRGFAIPRRAIELLGNQLPGVA